MKAATTKSVIVIVILIALTCGALAYSKHYNQHQHHQPPIQQTTQNDLISFSGKLTQNKVYTGGDGTIGIALTLAAADVINAASAEARHVDLVIVLDQSGSMQGQKINDARQAINDILSRLRARDRFAFITYANSVKSHGPLEFVTTNHRNRLSAIVQNIEAGGGTNLGAGLQEGIKALTRAERTGNVGKLILISDGLTNQGITDPTSLGNIAAQAIASEFAISTVGVGNDFNETLMTNLADRGAGTYHYLENPVAFASVFENEFQKSRTLAAQSMKITVPLSDGMILVHAAGYPIETHGQEAVFYPGNLVSGQERKIFMQLRVPTTQKAKFEIAPIRLDYDADQNRHSIHLAESFQVACVDNFKEAVASIDKIEWEQKVLQDDYNQLKEEVAQDLKGGRKKDALDRITRYSTAQSSINAAVGSDKVAKNITEDVSKLRSTVNDTFSGAPAAVAEKQKSTSKALQFESYQSRRVK